MKKIFSAFLLMTMMVASVGSFVSCSDIEDAIAKVENTANDNAAQIKDLEGKIAALQTALATAQADAAAAKAEANAAKQAAATARAEAIEAALAEIAKVQDDVDAANAEIKKINDALAGYATKEAVELLESTMDKYSALTDKNAEAIEAIKAELAALKEAGVTAEKFAEVVAKMEKINKDLVNFAKAIANQIQSISYVPEYESGMQTYSYTMPTGPKAADKKDFILVMGTYEVSPKELAAELTNENTFFTAVQTKAAGKAETFAARIVSTDAATGRVVAYAYIPATELNPLAVDVYNKIDAGSEMVALAFGVADENIVNETENVDLGSYVTSSYEKVDYKNALDIKNEIYFYNGLAFAQAIDPVSEVEFNTAIANSTRNLFEGYMYVVNLGSGVYTLAQAEAILGTPLAITYTDGVVEYNGTDANKYIKVTGKKYDATAALIKAATKDQVGLNATLELDGDILLNGKVTNLYAKATYEIVNKTYGAIVVEPVSKAWAYDKVDAGKYAAFTAVELGVTGINNVNDLFTMAGANSFTMTETVAGVTYTATIMKYESTDAASTASKIVKASIPALPFGKTYVFETTLTKDNVDYPVSFEVTIGAAPKNVEIDLGTLNATVSANKATVINNNFVGQALAKHAEFYTGVTFGQVFESFDDATTTVFVDNLDVETATTAVTFTPAAKKNSSNEYVDAEGKKTTDAKKYVEASTISIDGLAKGTYNLKHTVTVFGVKYTYVAVINVAEPTYSLSTVPQFVKDGQVIVSGVTTMPKFTLTKDADGNVTASTKTADAEFESNEINLKHYFVVDGLDKAFANDVKVVYVVKKYTADQKYKGIWPGATEVNVKNTVLATVSNSSAVSTADGKTLADAKVQWATDVDVDRVEVTAYLVKSTVSDTATETALNNAAYDKETITIVQRDRITSFTQKANTGTVEYKSGENVVDFLKFIETKDFNGNILSNPYATNKTDYWHTPTGKGTDVVDAKVAELYGQEIVIGTPTCDLPTAAVAITNDQLVFTNNSAELQSNVVVTIPVYVGYEYDNYGSTAKKVEVKVTFTPKN